MRVFLWLFAGVGILALVLILSMFGFAVVGFGKAAGLLKEGASYSDETIAAYSAEWDSSTLLERGSPEFLSAISQNPAGLTQLDQMLKTRAGALVSVEPSACSEFNYKSGTDGSRFVTACTAKGKAEGGDINFRVTVLKANDKWQLMGMFVNVDPGVVEKDQSVQVSFGASEPLDFGENNHLAPLRFGFDDIEVAAGPDVRRINLSRGNMIEGAAGLQVGAHVSRDMMAPSLDDIQPESQPTEEILAE